jgi:hypothetical protein
MKLFSKRSSEEFYKLLQKILLVFEKVFLTVVKSYLNTVVGQGFLKKVVNWMADKLYEETFKPVLEIMLVRAGYKYDVRDGEIFIERLKKAEESGNASDYDSTIDDILS